MKETDERFLNLSKKIGMFVIIAILGIAAVIIFIGIQRDIFTHKTTIYFIADNGQGLNEGQAVKLSGFKIGKLERLYLDDVAKVKVELSINTKYTKWIKTDSIVRLVKEGFIGDPIIEIVPGSQNANKVSEGGQIKFHGAKGFNEIIEELKEEIKPALVDVKQIIHYINDPEGDIKKTLKNINKLSEDMFTTKELIDKMLKNTDKNLDTTIKNVDRLVSSIKETADTTNNMLKNVETKMPVLLERVDKSLVNVQKITEDIKNTTKNVPVLMDKASDIADDTQDIVSSVKKVWPISSNIKTPQEKMLKVDSYE